MNLENSLPWERQFVIGWLEINCYRLSPGHKMRFYTHRFHYSNRELRCSYWNSKPKITVRVNRGSIQTWQLNCYSSLSIDWIIKLNYVSGLEEEHYNRLWTWCIVDLDFILLEIYWLVSAENVSRLRDSIMTWSWKLTHMNACEFIEF